MHFKYHIHVHTHYRWPQQSAVHWSHSGYHYHHSCHLNGNNHRWCLLLSLSQQEATDSAPATHSNSIIISQSSNESRNMSKIYLAQELSTTFQVQCSCMILWQWADTSLLSCSYDCYPFYDIKQNKLEKLVNLWIIIQQGLCSCPSYAGARRGWHGWAQD